MKFTKAVSATRNTLKGSTKKAEAIAADPELSTVLRETLSALGGLVAGAPRRES